MPMTDNDTAELEKLIKKARQKDLPFGLCLGKKPEENVMCMDLKKSPEVMMRKAKAEGDTAKVTYGTCGVQGKIMTLTLEGKMLPGLAKNAKVFMNKIGLKMKVVIADPDGNLLDSDGDEDEDLTPEEAADIEQEMAQDTNDEDTSENEVDPQAAEWEQIAAALQPLTDRFAESGDPRAAQIATAWDGALKAAGKGDFKSAKAVAGKLKPILTSGPQNVADTNAENDPNAAKWIKIQAPIEALYTKAMSRNPPERSKMEAAWGMALEAAEAGDYTKAINIVTRLKPMLDQAASATDLGQDGEVPADVVAFQKSRVLWQGTRQKMREELESLKKAITDVCKEDPGLQPVVQAASNLPDRLTGFDDALENILDDITNTPDGPQRAALKKSAIEKIKEYSGILQEPFFKDVDDNNGFASVKVAATARASLASIAKALAA